MNQIVPASFGQISNRFAAIPATDDLSSGIQSSFGLIGYKGKVWSIRYRGDEQQLMRDDGDGPRGSIEVVILRASTTISKIWYKDGYVDGSTAAPDCFSNNGVVPEAASANKQCDTCALCPHNQWGSRITPAGKQGKACSDSKRLAVVPAGDLNNDAYGGPMLLRVPAASLQDLAMYGQKMQQMGYPYYAVSTKISFDASEAYPKFLFQGLRPLSDDEADIVLATRSGHTVERILSENEFTPASTTAAPQQDAPLFEQAPDVGAKQPAQTQQTNTVGDQARAAAAAQAQNNAPKKAATSKQATGFGGAAAAKPKVEPVQQVQQEPKTQPVQTPADQTVAIDPRVMQLILAGVPADQAKALVDGENAAKQVAHEVTTQVTQQEASPAIEHEADDAGDSEPGVAQPSDFADNLDAMLSDLLPTLNK